MPRLNPRRAIRIRQFRVPLFAALLTRLDRWAAFLHPSRSANPEHLLGQRGEELAYWLLRRQGYTIVARNYRRPPHRGEIDLIAWDQGVLVFIEVKSREQRGAYAAERAVDHDKRRQLMRLARAYARRRALTGAYRFDVVAVYQPHGPHPELELLKDAFQAE